MNLQKLISNGHSVTMICGSYWIADTGLSGEFKKGKRCGVVDGIKIIELELNYSNKNISKTNLHILKYSFSD